MKKIATGVIAICYSLLTLYGQDELPTKYSIIVGGGASIPHIEGTQNSFFQKHNNRIGYNLLSEGRYYFHPNMGVSVQYDFVNVTSNPDKMHMHFIHPNFILRNLWDNGCQGAFLTIGLGYMDYQERTYTQSVARGTYFQKGYCGFSLGLGYESRLAKALSLVCRIDFLTADWFANPNASVFNSTEYDNGENQYWFKNNVNFLNFSLALQFGK